MGKCTSRHLFSNGGLIRETDLKNYAVVYHKMFSVPKSHVLSNRFPVMSHSTRRDSLYNTAGIVVFARGFLQLQMRSTKPPRLQCNR